MQGCDSGRKGVIAMSIGSIDNYGGFSGISAKNTANAGLANSLFGSKNSLYTDYSLIKSGAYKKLLTAYYDQQKANDTTSTKKTAETKKATETANTKKANDTTTDKTSAASTTAKKTEEADVNTLAKSAADQLKTSAVTLRNRDLYKATGTDEEGKATYDRDAITKSVNSFVTNYNQALASGKDSTSKSVARNLSSMVSATSANQRLLKEVGIQIGDDNKLIVDEKKLAEADVNKLSSLFGGSGSYADSVASKADSISKAAYNEANLSSSYSNNGSYQKTDVSKILDQYL